MVATTGAMNFTAATVSTVETQCEVVAVSTAVAEVMEADTDNLISLRERENGWQRKLPAVFFCLAKLSIEASEPPSD
jgi:hypothetical protein